MVGKKTKRRRIFCIARKSHTIHISLCMKFYWNVAAPPTSGCLWLSLCYPGRAKEQLRHRPYSLQSQKYLPSGVFRKSLPSSYKHFSLIKAKENKNDLNKQHVTLIKSEGKEYDAVREKYRLAQMRLKC